MAEIEHFVDPLNKTHPKFKNVKDIKLPMLTKEAQLEHLPAVTDLTIGKITR